MGSRHFEITEEQKKEYASGILLDLMQKDDTSFSVVLTGGDCDLEPLFIHMMAKDYVSIDDDNCYYITAKGLEKFDNLKKRYEEYLAHFDLYCAVDLEKGEFAFDKIFDMDDDEWDDYLSQDRFEDIRIAIAWFKKINPTDFVFLSFLKEEQFDFTRDGWQFELLSGLIWQEMEGIVDTALNIEDLAYTDDTGENVPGEVVVEDILRQGASLNEKLHAQEANISQDESKYPNDFYDDQQEPYIVTTYENYYDPYYISPIWFLF